MNRITKGLALGILPILLLTACSEDPKPAGDAGLLDLVPADTPYVFVSNRRLPASLAERFADHAARQLSVQRAAFGQMREQLDSEPSQTELPSEAMQAFEVLDALLAEFEGRDTAAKLREIGIEPVPKAVYFGLGILPAARVEITDATALEALLDRVEEKSALVTVRGEIDGQAYRRIDLGRVDAVLAVTPTQLVAGLLPDSLFDRDLPLLLGQVPPKDSLADSGEIPELTERYGFTGHGEGFIRLDTLVASVLGRASGLNADVMQALGTESLPASTGCMQLVEQMVAGMPRMVVGVSEATEQQLAVRSVWESTSGVNHYLQRIAAPVPGVGDGYDGLLAMGMGVDLPQLRAAIEALLRQVVAQGQECEWVDSATIEAAIPQLSLVLGPMTAGIKGFNLQLAEVVIDQETLEPQTVNASLLAAVDDPRGIFALGAMFNPALGALEIPMDGTLVELPQDVVADQRTPPMRVAIKDKALLLLAGDADAEDGLAMFSAPFVEPTPWFSMDYSVRQFVELLGSVLDQAVAQLEAQGETEMADELVAQLADFRTQAELFERLRVSIYANEQGLVVDQVMELR